MVETRALEIKLQKDDGTNEVGRATAAELSKSLADIYQRAKVDKNYLFDASIWRRKSQALPTPPMLEVPRRTDQPSIPIISLSTASPVEEEHKEIIIALDGSPNLSAGKLGRPSVAAEEVSSTG